MEQTTGARGLLRRQPLLADVLLAAAVFGSEMALWRLGPHDFWPHSWSIGLTWYAISAVAVALRRRATWVAVGLLAVHTAVSAIGLPQLPSDGFALIVVTGSVAAYLPLRRAVAAALLMWLPGMVLMFVYTDRFTHLADLPVSYFGVFNALVALVSFVLGRNVHVRRAYVRALEGRAQAALASQAAMTAQAVTDERRRIARELHDVVAHHVAVIGVMATAGRRTLHRDPAATDEALGTIEEMGRTALREMRRLLDVLRAGQEPADELTPQPGLAGLDQLLEQFREAGLPVTLAATGSSDALAPGAALTVYRLTQEALTNTLKHAGPNVAAQVRLVFGRQWVIVEVLDDGRGPAPVPRLAGHGLVGMRERVSLYGGSLRTGARPGGGFRVYAMIPAETTDGPQIPAVPVRPGGPGHQPAGPGFPGRQDHDRDRRGPDQRPVPPRQADPTRHEGRPTVPPQPEEP